MKDIQQFNIRESAGSCYRFLLCVAVFVISFKFCAFISVEQGNFPMGIMEWLIFSCWPEFLVPVTGALALLGAVAIYPPPVCRKEAWLIPILALLTVFSGLPGLIHTTEWKYAGDWMAHFGGNFCLVTAVWYASFHDRKLLPAILNVLAVSCIISCLKGWYQHFGGLEDNMQMMIENAQVTGQHLTQKMIAKLHQTRSLGYFADPNIYAAHILLLGPVMVKVLADWSGRFTPRRLSFFIFTILGIVLAFGAVIWSGSRGAVLGIIAGLGVLFWLSRIPLRWKVLILGAGLAGGLCLLIWVTRDSGRDFSTASVRLQYYSAAGKMFLRHPFAGVGLGEFFPWHMRLKAVGFEEARDVHSLFFAQLSQCGIIGGLVGLLRILLPFLLVLGFLKKYRPDSRPLYMAAAAAWCGWNIHALVQFNDMIPATYSFVLIIGLAMLSPEKLSRPSALPEKRVCFLRLGFCLPGLLCLLPALVCSGERNLQIGDTSLRSNPVVAGSYLYDAASSLPLSPVPWRLLAEYNIAAGDYSEAVRCNRELVRRSPHRSSSYCRLVRSMLLAGEDGEIAGLLDQAQLWYPGNSQVYYLRALRQIAPELRMTGMIQSRRMLADLIALRAKIREEKDCVVISLTPAERQNFYLGTGLLGKLNAAGIRFADSRPVRFKEGD